MLARIDAIDFNNVVIFDSNKYFITGSHSVTLVHSIYYEPIENGAHIVVEPNIGATKYHIYHHGPYTVYTRRELETTDVNTPKLSAAALLN